MCQACLVFGARHTLGRVLETAVDDGLHQLGLEQEVPEAGAVDGHVRPLDVLLFPCGLGWLCCRVFILLVVEEIFVLVITQRVVAQRGAGRGYKGARNPTFRPPCATPRWVAHRPQEIRGPQQPWPHRKGASRAPGVPWPLHLPPRSSNRARVAPGVGKRAPVY